MVACLVVLQKQPAAIHRKHVVFMHERLGETRHAFWSMLQQEPQRVTASVGLPTRGGKVGIGKREQEPSRGVRLAIAALQPAATALSGNHCCSRVYPRDLAAAESRDVGGQKGIFALRLLLDLLLQPLGKVFRSRPTGPPPSWPAFPLRKAWREVQGAATGFSTSRIRSKHGPSAVFSFDRAPFRPRGQRSVETAPPLSRGKTPCRLLSIHPEIETCSMTLVRRLATVYHLLLPTGATIN